MVSLTDDGKYEFRVYLPHAARVELVGDFTDWKRGRVPLRRERDGWWRLTLPISSGEHQFSYLVDDALYLPDYAAHGVELNNYGGWVSRLLVPEVRARAMAA
ncbi:MAG: hypothetical protein JNM07_04160 [Phycisphaerae bacterium]|nr:hypothetical protein [Phycisphaerae bacterium]